MTPQKRSQNSAGGAAKKLLRSSGNAELLRYCGTLHMAKPALSNVTLPSLPASKALVTSFAAVCIVVLIMLLDMHKSHMLLSQTQHQDMLIAVHLHA